MTPPNFDATDTFVPRRWIRSGDLQTIAAAYAKPATRPGATTRHTINVGQRSDADVIALFQNDPDRQTLDPPISNRLTTNGSARNESLGNVLLVHGITGCHGAPYMLRMASTMLSAGYRTFRMDARGCGSLQLAATTITHAGRSDDIGAAADWIAHRHREPLHVVGVSLGGNQTLRWVSRIGRGADPPGAGYRLLHSVTAVAPPIDLAACADSMDRPRNRVYNHYFIRGLMRRMSPAIAASPVVTDYRRNPPAKTLRQFDDRLTAPLAGYRGWRDYYDDASTASDLDAISIPTRIIAAADDPIIPANLFESLNLTLGNAPDRVTSTADDSRIEVQLTRYGGHAAYIGPRGTRWLDEQIRHWIGRNGGPSSSLSH